MADRILVMNSGEIVQQGRPQDIYQSPASIFIAELFGAVTILPTSWRDGKIHTIFGAKNPPAWAQMGDDILLGVRPDVLTVSTVPTPPTDSDAQQTSPLARLIALKPMGAICELTLELSPNTGFTLTIPARIAINSELYDNLIGNHARNPIGRMLWLDVAEHNCLWFRGERQRAAAMRRTVQIPRKTAPR